MLKPHSFNSTALPCVFNGLKTHYPDIIHIYLVRNPRHQFHSYLSMQQSERLDIFLTMDLLTVSINRNSQYFKPLAERIPVYEYHSGSFEEERQVYSRLLPLYNDFILNIDLLSDEPGYRRKVMERFETMGIQGQGTSIVLGTHCEGVRKIVRGIMKP